MTIKEIAAMCGVSRGTVDRVLNHRGRVKPETEQAVRAALEQAGYTKNIAGRALTVRRLAPRIGVVLCCLGNPFFDEVLKGISQAEEELRTLTAALKEILDITTEAFSRDDIRLAKQVEPLEQVIDCLIADIKSNHIVRLQNGHCTIEMGFVLSDILTNCERVSDHCSNIAVAQIETEQNAYQAHEYLNGVKNAGNEDFQQSFDHYRACYSLKSASAED